VSIGERFAEICTCSDSIASCYRLHALLKLAELLAK
jgi:hypothetical protein